MWQHVGRADIENLKVKQIEPQFRVPEDEINESTRVTPQQQAQKKSIFYAFQSKWVVVGILDPI